MLALVDVVLEGVAWVWIVERFGLKSRDRRGVQAFLAGKAGMLMPAQLGRLIRPDAMARMGRGTVGECLKAEGAVFVLDSLAVLALLVALVGYRFHPALALPAALALVVAALFLGERVIRLIARTRFDLPRGFLWTWQSAAAVGVLMAGWAAHGLAFYVLVADLPGTFQMWDALVMAPASAVLGVGSGLPGGIGAIEGFLGYSLSSGGVPGGHMALAVAGFRLLTFWAWIVIGWVALGAIARRARRAAPAARAAG